jgi:hypothetical protein
MRRKVIKFTFCLLLAKLLTKEIKKKFAGQPASTKITTKRYFNG